MAAIPNSPSGNARLLSGGSAKAAIAISSQPTTATSSGILTPNFLRLFIAHCRNAGEDVNLSWGRRRLKPEEEDRGGRGEPGDGLQYKYKQGLPWSPR